MQHVVASVLATKSKHVNTERRTSAGGVLSARPARRRGTNCQTRSRFCRTHYQVHEEKKPATRVRARVRPHHARCPAEIHFVQLQRPAQDGRRVDHRQRRQPCRTKSAFNVGRAKLENALWFRGRISARTLKKRSSDDRALTKCGRPRAAWSRDRPDSAGPQSERDEKTPNKTPSGCDRTRFAKQNAEKCRSHHHVDAVPEPHGLSRGCVGAQA